MSTYSEMSPECNQMTINEIMSSTFSMDSSLKTKNLFSNFKLKTSLCIAQDKVYYTALSQVNGFSGLGFEKRLLPGRAFSCGSMVY